MKRRDVAMDAATQHRAAGIFGLAFGAAAITSLAGVFGLDIFAMKLEPLLALASIPDATWPARWLPGAVTAAYQQNTAVQQWMDIILIFGAITAAVACINALIGFVSHTNERRYETALRGLIGASPTDIRRSLRRDALINGALGAGTGILVGGVMAVLLRRMWLSSTSMDNAWPLLAVSVCFAVAAYASRVSAMRLRTKGWMGDALAPEARTVPGFGAEDLRALLTTAQLACAVALTVVSLLVWSYASTASAAASIARNDRYVARAHGSYPEVLAAVREAGAQAESIASPGALLGIGKIDHIVSDCGRCIHAQMYAPMFPVETQVHVAGPSFFQVAGINVRHGREFSMSNDPDRVVVVNETFSRQAFRGQNAIGKRILVGGFEQGVWYSVIGVIDDVRIEGVHFAEPGAHKPAGGQALPGYAPAIYLSASEHPPTEFDVIITSAERPATLAGLSFEPLTGLIARARAPQRSFSRVLTFLGLLLCGAALLGSFTSTMLSVRARRIEIALRRAVGARRSDVRRLVYARVISVTLRGIFAGLVLSVALTRVVEVFVPGLRMFELRAALGVAAAFFILSVIATIIPLRAALRISPAQTHV